MPVHRYTYSRKIAHIFVWRSVDVQMTILTYKSTLGAHFRFFNSSCCLCSLVSRPLATNHKFAYLKVLRRTDNPYHTFKLHIFTTFYIPGRLCRTLTLWIWMKNINLKPEKTIRTHCHFLLQTCLRLPFAVQPYITSIFKPSAMTPFSRQSSNIYFLGSPYFRPPFASQRLPDLYCDWQVLKTPLTRHAAVTMFLHETVKANQICDT